MAAIAEAHATAPLSGFSDGLRENAALNACRNSVKRLVTQVRVALGRLRLAVPQGFSYQI